jgi:hypothetical protein
MPSGLETAGRVNRQSPLSQGLTLFHGLYSLPWREKPKILGANDLKRCKGIMDLGKIDVLRRYPSHLIGLLSGNLSGPKAGKRITISEA